MTFTLHSFEDTHKLAKLIVKMSQPQQLIILSGPLGAGKTNLVQQITKVLKSPASATSPTYTLIHEYPSPEGLIIHIDAYRLNSAEQLFDLGLEDYLERSRLVLVEWGEALAEHYPDALLVKIAFENDIRIASLKQNK